MENYSREFEEMVSLYEERLELVNNTALKPYYTLTDFSLMEPFYTELYNISSESMKFISESEAIESGEHFYIYFINSDKQLGYKRYVCGSASYDTYYEYRDKSACAYTVFISGEKKKPISFEKKYFNEYEFPTRFISKRGEGFVEHTYDYFPDYIDISVWNHGLKKSESPLYSMKVEIVDGQVERIERENPDGERFTVFSKKSMNLSKEEMGKIIVKGITRVIEDKLENEINIDEELSCLLLEYNLQHPFPSTVALGTTIEKQETIDAQYGVMAFLNAPDMEYFYEFSYEIEVNGINVEACMNTFNSSYNCHEPEVDFEELKEFVFDCYFKICQKLKNSSVFKKFKLADDFVITARDFEECNGDRFLKKVLSEKEYEDFFKPDENLPPLTSTEQDNLLAELEVRAKEYNEEKQIHLDYIKTHIKNPLYSKNNPIILSPYSYEIKNSKLYEVITCSKEEISDENYYEYAVEDNKILCKITYYENNKKIMTAYYHNKNWIKEVSFSIDGDQIEYSSSAQLNLRNGKSALYESYTRRSFHEVCVTEKNPTLLHLDSERTFFTSGIAVEENSNYNVTLDEKGNLVLITLFRPEIDEVPYISFSKDLSYLKKEKEEISKEYSEKIAKAFREELKLKETFDCLIIVYTPKLPFWPKMYLGVKTPKDTDEYAHIIGDYTVKHSLENHQKFRYYEDQRYFNYAVYVEREESFDDKDFTSFYGDVCKYIEANDLGKGIKKSDDFQVISVLGYD